MKQRSWMLFAAPLALALGTTACERGEADEASKAVDVKREAPLPAPVQQGTDPLGATRTPMEDACPAAMDGVRVTVEDTDGGVALRFTGEQADLHELRQRTTALGRTYDTLPRQAGSPVPTMTPEGRTEPAAGVSAQLRDTPASSATVEEIEGGARLILVPEEQAQLDVLRDSVRAHARRMQTGQCWTLGEAGEQSPEVER